MWLLKFPRLRTTRYRAARNSAVTSLVVVLPALPVIATTFVPDSRRIACARSCSADRRVLDFDHDRRARPAFARRAAFACHPRGPRPPPRRRRSPRAAKSAPSNRSPRMRDVTDRRRCSVRVSIDTSPNSRPASPAITRAAHLRARPMRRVNVICVTRRPTCVRRRASASRATATSSNGSVRSPITWYFSWPLPAISTTSPAAPVRSPWRSPPRDRRSPAAAASAVASRVRRDAALNLLDDPVRILAARVVRRDHDHDRSAGRRPRPSAAAWCDRDRRRSQTP